VVGAAGLDERGTKESRLSMKMVNIVCLTSRMIEVIETCALMTPRVIRNSNLQILSLSESS
jgi:hypothetical protein